MKILSKTDQLQLSDEALVRYFLESKDDAALGILYDRYTTPLFKKCYAITGNRETARDLTHDIFIKVFLNLHQFREGAAFHYWIHRIGYNHCISFLRQQKRLRWIDTPADELHDLAASEEGLQEKIQQEAKLEVMEQAFLQLAESDRVVLSMKYHSNFSVVQIAEMMEVAEGAVKMRLKRGRDRLADIVHRLNAEAR